MKIDAADVLTVCGMVATIAGVYHFSSWGALILCGVYLLAAGAICERANARKRREP